MNIFGFQGGGSGGGSGGGLTYLGLWNASTNTPLIASGIGIAGSYYIVSVPGNTTIDGISDWGIGDWIIFSGTVWQKIDNSDLEGYNLIQNQGTPLPKESVINFKGAGVTASAGVGVTEVTIDTVGGGSSIAYYLNGSINQGVFGGNTYYQLSKNAIIGAGTDFSLNANGIIARFITDANDPALLEIPSGDWTCGFHFSASSNGGSPQFYVKFYKYDGVSFTLIADNSLFPETITQGTTIDDYFFTIAFPLTPLTITDRIAVEVYVIHDGRTITLHTEDSHLCEIITTFSKGIINLNGLIKQIQNFATGVAGTNFNIVSSVDTHTFNLPVASAINTGKLSNADWTTFNNKLSQAYQTIQEEGVPLIQRSTLDFRGGYVTAVDDPINSKTVVNIGGFGIFGISDANGKYTFYTTLTLALASAVSGQTIEQFADYVETGAVSVALVDGVNINMNGHTYTIQEATTNFSAFVANNVSCQFLNGTIKIDSGAGTNTITGLTLGLASNIDCSGLQIKVVSSNGFGRGATLGTSGCTLSNLFVQTIDQQGIAGTGNSTFYYCFAQSSTSTAFSIGSTAGTSGSNFAYNCIGVSNSGVGFSVGFNSSAIECSARSSSNYAFNVNAGLIVGGYAQNPSGTAVFANTSASITANNFRIRGLNVYGQVYLNYASGGIGSVGQGSFEDCSVFVVGTDGIVVNTNGIYQNRITVANCSIRLTTSGNKCLVGTAVSTYCNYANNSFIGATTPVDATILQGITNTQDNQGNILISS